MNILMMTNTYTPILGGLEKSIATFSNAYRRRGHRVLIAAPTFEGAPANEKGVRRIPAIQHFNGSDFSVILPLLPKHSRALLAFKPDIIHAHHPFLIGSAALRLAHNYQIPLVFTHHTLFERYTHYTPVDLPVMARFVVKLSTEFANLSDRVFAPSESIAQLLRGRGVKAPIDVVPTGISLKRFRTGNRAAGRAQWNIPREAFVIGHVGRLAPEKNPVFLAQAVAAFLRRRRDAVFFIVGGGPSADQMRNVCRAAGVARQLRMSGALKEPKLFDAYRAMDVFAFASKSETQGLVVTEAMAAGLPVIALDAPGAREVLEDGINGILLHTEDTDTFAYAIQFLADRTDAELSKLRASARKTAARFSVQRCVTRALSLYASISAKARRHDAGKRAVWLEAARRIKTEWELLRNVTAAAGSALMMPNSLNKPAYGKKISAPTGNWSKR